MGIELSEEIRSHPNFNAKYYHAALEWAKTLGVHACVAEEVVCTYNDRLESACNSGLWPFYPSEYVSLAWEAVREWDAV